MDFYFASDKSKLLITTFQIQMKKNHKLISRLTELKNIICIQIGTTPVPYRNEQKQLPAFQATVIS